jgi:drug/metabolite transporter (DMT)-like permease
LAVVVFGDFIAWREAAATTLIVFGAFALSYTPDVAIAARLLGILAVIAACLCWAIDNNLTQRLSLRDPVAVVRTKTWIAGSCSLALALLLGQQLPRASIVVESLLLGLMSYGMSLVLAVHAMRLLGAAREAAFFATAPFVGALAAVPLLGERLGLGQLLAMALMALGVGFLIRERHDHEHSHEVLEHEHAHIHDAHHEHTHSTSHPPGEPHAHAHVHAVMTHHHPHASDAHHRHRH